MIRPTAGRAGGGGDLAAPPRRDRAALGGAIRRDCDRRAPGVPVRRDGAARRRAARVPPDRRQRQRDDRRGRAAVSAQAATPPHHCRRCSRRCSSPTRSTSSARPSSRSALGQLPTRARRDRPGRARAPRCSGRVEGGDEHGAEVPGEVGPHRRRHAQDGAPDAGGPRAQEAALQVHADVERAWRTRFGADAPSGSGSAWTACSSSGRPRARLSLGLCRRIGRLARDPALRRADERGRRRREGGLAHYPMVLHRGGWPDGS